MACTTAPAPRFAQVPIHGGPDGGPPIRHDFSTNASPLGPPPALARDLVLVDRSRYPDPAYGALRAALAGAHGVEPERVLPSAGTSEAIRRLTLAASLHGVRHVWVPQPGYGDYAAAAHALGLALHGYASEAQLLLGLAAQADVPALAWLCEPCNPTGQSLSRAFWARLGRQLETRPHLVAIDRAYEPLRLCARDPLPPSVAARCWQCFSPNKALGVTGVRAGYLLAPAIEALPLRKRLEALAPSWVLAAEGVVLLEALHTAPTRAWLAAARATLVDWSRLQRHALASLGWEQRPAIAPFWLARPGAPEALPRRLTLLRECGIKLRDASSFGLPGWVRVSVQPPASQQALCAAWRRLG